MAQQVDKAMENLANANNRKYQFKKTLTIDGYHKTGTFVARVPSVMDRISVGIKRANILKDAPAQVVNGTAQTVIDPFTDDVAFMIAFLDTILEKRPKWLVWENLDKVDELREMFTEVSKWANTFQGGTKPEKAEDGGLGEPATDEEDMAGDEDV